MGRIGKTSIITSAVYENQVPRLADFVSRYRWTAYTPAGTREGRDGAGAGKVKFKGRAEVCVDTAGQLSDGVLACTITRAP